MLALESPQHRLEKKTQYRRRDSREKQPSEAQHGEVAEDLDGPAKPPVVADARPGDTVIYAEEKQDEDRDRADDAEDERVALRRGERVFEGETDRLEERAHAKWTRDRPEGATLLSRGTAPYTPPALINPRVLLRMTRTDHDVLGIGNAIVDVIAHADDAFLERRSLVKGTMRIVGAADADLLYGEMGPGVEMSGGSVANTVAGVASFGGRAAYIGRIRDDLLGRVFRHDITAAGVTYRVPAASEGPGTARCLILVTPDAQRTMNTYLGACVELGREDLDRALIESAAITYLEGYLFDPPKAKAALREAAEIAHAAGRKVSLSLSDPFCVERHRADFRALVEDQIDVLFANEIEICSLYETEDFETAARAVRGHCEIAVLTRSAKGSLVVTADGILEIAAAPVERVVDTTGAGDLYASGFLHGLTQGRPLETCGRLGSLAAAEIIGHVGARPEASLKELAQRAGLA